MLSRSDTLRYNYTMTMRAQCWLCLAAFIFAIAVAGPASAEWYAARKVRPPEGNRLFVCHGYSCRIVTPVQFSEADVARIAAPLGDPPRNAAEERSALSESVQLFETIVGARIGTSRDLPGMQFGKGLDGQMDCIDEATNTTSLMRLLAARGALAHHTVAEPASRGFFLDGRYPHATAVVAETANRKKWVIDSWPDANARPPLIQPLADWRRARRSLPPA